MRSGEKNKLSYTRVLHANKATLLLDSSLILATLKKDYSIKLVDCNDYIQVYLYNGLKIKKEKKEFDLNLSKISNDIIIENTFESEKEKPPSQEIELKNIIRSKLKCQRLAKANSKCWKTFITLTFADNVTDINFANKQFKYFVDKVRRIKKDFKYIAIPEFQERGAAHYHLITNISIKDKRLIINQNDNNYFKHIKYWNNGFTNVKGIKGDLKLVIGYISKYMTKKIDNRLFSKHRYLYSKNLDIPKESYVDPNKINELEFYIKKIQDTTLIYKSDYTSYYDNSKVEFLEFIKNS